MSLHAQNLIYAAPDPSSPRRSWRWSRRAARAHPTHRRVGEVERAAAPRERRGIAAVPRIVNAARSGSLIVELEERRIGGRRDLVDRTAAPEVRGYATVGRGREAEREAGRRPDPTVGADAGDVLVAALGDPERPVAADRDAARIADGGLGCDATGVLLEADAAVGVRRRCARSRRTRCDAPRGPFGDVQAGGRVSQMTSLGSWSAVSIRRPAVGRLGVGTRSRRARSRMSR